MRALRPAVTALLLCLAPSPGAADPLITKTYAYFSVSGSTGAELERELSSLGPMLSDTGTRHAGATRIKLGGSVEYEKTVSSNCPDCKEPQASGGSLPDLLGLGPRRSGCRVLDAKVTLETQLTLPRWRDRKKASREMVLIWDVLSADIKRHEERHAEMARQYARKLEKALEDLRPERTCETLQTRVDAVTKKIVDKHAADQVRFDRAEAASFERRMTRMLGFAVEKERRGR
ncbi:DUF922 domain-containing protein [Hoeflea sp.]|uniref:DUF922 domain-containing Zn-dependent protease n=1 Tax=Hoeflea sp. TaxID=1940281 RepID=UPI0019C21C77|nr:DUF922 domain-containing protein [Hoeflea sp.]MBC7283038.1 DUF922 domain-containing protein [Hoeflea sp.]